MIFFYSDVKRNLFFLYEVARLVDLLLFLSVIVILSALNPTEDLWGNFLYKQLTVNPLTLFQLKGLNWFFVGLVLKGLKKSYHKCRTRHIRCGILCPTVKTCLRVLCGMLVLTFSELIFKDLWSHTVFNLVHHFQGLGDVHWINMKVLFLFYKWSFVCRYLSFSFSLLWVACTWFLRVLAQTVFVKFIQGFISATKHDVT